MNSGYRFRYQIWVNLVHIFVEFLLSIWSKHQIRGFIIWSNSPKFQWFGHIFVASLVETKWTKIEFHRPDQLWCQVIFNRVQYLYFYLFNKLLKINRALFSGGAAIGSGSGTRFARFFVVSLTGGCSCSRGAFILD